MDIKICKVDGRAVLKGDEKCIEIKDYKISSSMRSGTELEVIIPLTDIITEFSTSATQRLPLKPN